MSSLEKGRNSEDDVARLEHSSERLALEKKLLRKIDLRMSILIVIYILNYVSTHYLRWLSMKLTRPRLTAIMLRECSLNSSEPNSPTCRQRRPKTGPRNGSTSHGPGISDALVCEWCTIFNLSARSPILARSFMVRNFLSSHVICLRLPSRLHHNADPFVRIFSSCLSQTK